MKNEGYYLEVEVDSSKEKMIFYTSSAEEVKKGEYVVVESDFGEEVAFVVKEVDSKTTKVSMRSKKIDVAKICENFGGGGHTYAAGCTVKANIDETIKKLLREINL